jgi:hypothetical protein
MRRALDSIALYSADVLAMSGACRSFNEALLSEEHMNLGFVSMLDEAGTKANREELEILYCQESKHRALVAEFHRLWLQVDYVVFVARADQGRDDGLRSDRRRPHPAARCGRAGGAKGTQQLHLWTATIEMLLPLSVSLICPDRSNSALLSTSFSWRGGELEQIKIVSLPSAARTLLDWAPCARETWGSVVALLFRTGGGRASGNVCDISNNKGITVPGYLFSFAPSSSKSQSGS